MQAIQDMLHREHEESPAYLDDIGIITSRPELLDAITALFAPAVPDARPVDGLSLNVTKTKVTNLSTLRDDAAGLPFLGSMIGCQEARRTFFRDKVDDLQQAMRRLRCLPKQQSLLLLRSCFVPQLIHLLRDMDLHDLEDELDRLDACVYDAIAAIRSAAPRDPDGPLDPLVARIMSLRLSGGGLGLPCFAEVRPHARAACRAASTAQLRHMEVQLPVVDNGEEIDERSQWQRMTEVYAQATAALLDELSEEQRMVFVDNASKCGTMWLHAHPVGEGYRRLQDPEVATGLNIRLLQSDIHNSAQCARCALPNGPLHHEVCVPAGFPKQRRHNVIRDILCKQIRKSRWTEIEPLVAHPPILRRADFRIGAAAEGLNLDPIYGLADLKVKCILAHDTLAARQQVPQPGEEVSAWQHARAHINASLQVAWTDCELSYAALNLEPTVRPLVISSGGTLHKDMHQLLQTVAPSADRRRKVLIDISIALLRARGVSYDLTH